LSFQGLPKTYTGTFTLGGTTVSFDLEIDVDQHFPTEHITEEMIRKVALSFIDKHDQEPPVFSANKIDGERPYDLARAGKDVKTKTSPIEITTFEITRIALPEVDFKIDCSKGTYIRSLARDFGLALKSGAYLSSLRRTAIGTHLVENAQTIEQLTASIRS
jgi:tRNA pseudouridine55 synthase